MSRLNKADGRVRRHIRLRKKIRGTESRPRLAVFKSNTNIYAQVINDKTGETIVSASSLEKEFRAKLLKLLAKQLLNALKKKVCRQLYLIEVALYIMAE